MRYAVEVHLDYVTHPPEEVHQVWEQIRHAMTEAGFREEGRRFVSNMAPPRAASVAYAVMEGLDSSHGDESIFRYVKEFYGYPADCASNLMVPPLDRIEVRVGAVA